MRSGSLGKDLLLTCFSRKLIACLKCLLLPLILYSCASSSHQICMFLHYFLLSFFCKFSFPCTEKNIEFLILLHPYQIFLFRNEIKLCLGMEAKATAVYKESVLNLRTSVTINVSFLYMQQLGVTRLPGFDH